MNFSDSPSSLDFNPVVLLFTQGRRENFRKKPFYGLRKDQKERIIHNFSTVKTALNQQNVFPFIEFNEHRQNGNSFEERLTGAFRWAFQSGYNYVVVVGDDCPDLYTLDWNSLYASASRGFILAGPDFKGGMYLIGMTKESFDHQTFQNLKWKTKGLYKDFLRKFQQNQLHELPAKADLNDIKDVYSLLSIKKVTPFILSVFFRTFRNFENAPLIFLQDRLFSNPAGRKAPPIFSFF